ncbi:Serine proteinase stubble-like protein, partial [Dinothrombium tinctorium]
DGRSSAAEDNEQESIKQCGVLGCHILVEARLLGGRRAISGEFPWQVALYSKTESEFEYSCGGAIVAPQWLVNNFSQSRTEPEDLKGVIGVNDLASAQTSDEIFFDKVIVHENYTFETNREMLMDDIALLHVTKPIHFSSQLINAVCLPQKGKKSLKKADVTGWINAKQKGFSRNFLRKAVISLFPEKECARRFKTKFHVDAMLCAGFRNQKSMCIADIGGPLTQLRRNVNYLIGIASFGNTCVGKNYPRIYTRVSNYVDWINSHIAK